MNRSLSYLPFCTDVHGLTGSLGHNHRSEEWWLFTDVSKARQSFSPPYMKWITISPCFSRNSNERSIWEHGTSQLHTIERKPLECKRRYESLSSTCVARRLGCTKFCCSLCERDSPAKDCHYSAKEWPKHEHTACITRKKHEDNYWPSFR